MIINDVPADILRIAIYKKTASSVASGLSVITEPDVTVGRTNFLESSVKFRFTFHEFRLK